MRESPFFTGQTRVITASGLGNPSSTVKRVSQ